MVIFSHKSLSNFLLFKTEASSIFSKALNPLKDNVIEILYQNHFFLYQVFVCHLECILIYFYKLLRQFLALKELIMHVKDGFNAKPPIPSIAIVSHSFTNLHFQRAGNHTRKMGLSAL